MRRLRERAIPILRVLVVTSLLVLTAVTSLGVGCKEPAVEQHLEMKWEIPPGIEAFEGLEKAPQGEEVELINEDILKVTWQAGESYILPISATSDRELEGVRYCGHGIPTSFELEWLDIREGKWYPLEEIPPERIKVDLREEAGTFSIFFGPPQGADFQEGMVRGIWFRVTPTREGEFTFFIYGYLQNGEGDPDLITPLSNMLSCQGEVR